MAEFGRRHMAKPIIETAVQARAGVRGMPVLYMLLFGTTGVIVLFAAVYLHYFA